MAQPTSTLPDLTQREIADELEGRTIKNVRPEEDLTRPGGQKIVIEFEEGDPVIFEMNQPHVWMRLLSTT